MDLCSSSPLRGFRLGDVPFVCGLGAALCLCTTIHGFAAKVLWPESNAPSRRIFSHTSTALFEGDHLFSAKSSGELICVEANTGKKVWESDKVTDLKNGASIHLTSNGDSVLLYTDKGELIRAQLTSQGYKEISRVLVLPPTMPFGGRNVAWSPPAYANRCIFARSGKELICASLAAKP